MNRIDPRTGGELTPEAARAMRKRKRMVRMALRTGQTVPYDLRTLLEDGWSTATIRKVYRRTPELSEWQCAVRSGYWCKHSMI